MNLQPPDPPEDTREIGDVLNDTLQQLAEANKKLAEQQEEAVRLLKLEREGLGRNLTLLAEAQAHIKVLESYAEHRNDGIMFCERLKHSENECTCGLDDALSTTSPTEALDKVVREAKAQALEEAATYLEGDGAAFDDVQTLRERAEAMRRMEP